MYGGWLSVPRRSSIWRCCLTQYSFASRSDSAFRSAVPLKPVAACRETIYVSWPIGDTPEFEAHPAETRSIATMVNFIAVPLFRAAMMPNERVERPTTLLVPRPDAAHDVSRSAPTLC